MVLHKQQVLCLIVLFIVTSFIVYLSWELLMMPIWNILLLILSFAWNLIWMLGSLIISYAVNSLSVIWDGARQYLSWELLMMPIWWALNLLQLTLSFAWTLIWMLGRLIISYAVNALNVLWDGASPFLMGPFLEYFMSCWDYLMDSFYSCFKLAQNSWYFLGSLGDYFMDSFHNCFKMAQNICYSLGDYFMNSFNSYFKLAQDAWNCFLFLRDYYMAAVYGGITDLLILMRSYFLLLQGNCKFCFTLAQDCWNFFLAGLEQVNLKENFENLRIFIFEIVKKVSNFWNVDAQKGPFEKLRNFFGFIGAQESTILERIEQLYVVVMLFLIAQLLTLIKEVVNCLLIPLVRLLGLPINGILLIILLFFRGITLLIRLLVDGILQIIHLLIIDIVFRGIVSGILKIIHLLLIDLIFRGIVSGILRGMLQIIQSLFRGISPIICLLMSGILQSIYLLIDLFCLKLLVDLLFRGLVLFVVCIIIQLIHFLFDQVLLMTPQMLQLIADWGKIGTLIKRTWNSFLHIAGGMLKKIGTFAGGTLKKTGTFAGGTLKKIWTLIQRIGAFLISKIDITRVPKFDDVFWKAFTWILNYLIEKVKRKAPEIDQSGGQHQGNGDVVNQPGAVVNQPGAVVNQPGGVVPAERLDEEPVLEADEGSRPPNDQVKRVLLQILDILRKFDLQRDSSGLLEMNIDIHDLNSVKDSVQEWSHLQKEVHEPLKSLQERLEYMYAPTVTRMTQERFNVIMIDFQKIVDRGWLS